MQQTGNHRATAHPPPIEEAVTVICKTFERPASVARLIASIRAFYPRLRIVVADDSREPTVTASEGVDIIRMPYDSGVSEGRNRALAAVRTEFFVICDDDFEFCAQTRLERLLDVAQTTNFALVGGMIMDHRPKTGVCRGRLQFAGTVEFTNGVFRHVKRRNRGARHGWPVYDIIPYFFIARKATFGPDPWDARFKTGHEHGDFALSMLKRGFDATVVQNVWVNHHPARPAAYAVMRNRRDDFFSVLQSKWGVEKVEIVGNGRDYDLADKIRFGWPSKVRYAARRIGLGRVQRS